MFIEKYIASATISVAYTITVQVELGERDVDGLLVVEGIVEGVGGEGAGQAEGEAVGVMALLGNDAINRFFLYNPKF